MILSFQRPFGILYTSPNFYFVTKGTKYQDIRNTDRLIVKHIDFCWKLLPFITTLENGGWSLFGPIVIMCLDSMDIGFSNYMYISWETLLQIRSIHCNQIPLKLRIMLIIFYNAQTNLLILKCLWFNKKISIITSLI